MSEQLTRHFNRSEFACRGQNCCGGAAPINPDLVHALQRLRDIVGVPLTITSGFRCLTWNRKCGSRDTSQHPRGNAADVAVPHGYTATQFAEIAGTIPDFADGGIGVYPTKGFVHVDVREDGPARWDETDPHGGNA